MKTLNDLKTEYPDFFTLSNLGYDCGDGWVFLIEEICKYVKRSQSVYVRPNTGSPNVLSMIKIENFINFKFLQIKEKFGTLRTYYEISTPKIDLSSYDIDYYNKHQLQVSMYIGGFIEAIEAISGSICEYCGERGIPGSTDERAWIKTTCRYHRRLRQEAL